MSEPIVHGQDKPEDLPEDERKEIKDNRLFQVWIIFPNGESKESGSKKRDFETWEDADNLRDHLEEFFRDDNYVRAPSGLQFQSRSVRVELREIKGRNK